MFLPKINFAFCLIFLFLIQAYSQIPAGLDAGFVLELSTQNLSNASVKTIIQPDGKRLVYSQKIPSRISRLNADGSRDTSFNCSTCYIFSGSFVNLSTNLTNSVDPGSIALQPDGKILLAGITGDTNLPKIIRLNADGSLDSSFSSGLTTSSGLIVVQDVRSDGKIYVSLKQLSGTSATVTIYRLNVNGSIDNSFTPITSGNLSQFDNVSIKILSNGQVFIFGRNTAFGNIARVNNDGSKDSLFETPALTTSQPSIPGYIKDIAQQSDGKIVIVGTFIAVNGTSRETVARLNADGTVDSQFNTFGLFSNFESFRETDFVEVLPDNRLLVAGSRLVRKIARLSSNGTIDTTYGFINNIESVFDLTADSTGKAYVFVSVIANSIYKNLLLRLNADGTIDSGYSADTGAVGAITALALQNDGKIIVGGNFNKVNGVERNTIARLNADGTLDSSFNAGSGFDLTIFDIAALPNGKIVVVGEFTSVNGVSRNRIARLNTDGSVDTSFSVTFSDALPAVYTVTVQNDGKFIIGGEFSTTQRNSLARYNADGTLDTTFNPTVSTDSRFYDVFPQSDGKIIIVGRFTGISGANRNNVARLNADGSADTSFNYNAGEANQIIQQPDGKYLLRFQRATILRLNANGSLDTDFVIAQAQNNSDPQFFTMSLQPNGAIIVGGSFEAVNGQPRRNIARLLPNGRLDVNYSPKTADYAVNSSIVQTDGKVVIGGEFTHIGEATRFGVARLLQSAATVPPAKFDFDGDGKADISVFRPSNGNWFVRQSTNGFTAVQFGSTNDKTVSADYDGDGKSDIAVYRGGTWYLLRSTGGFTGVNFGRADDIPQPADVDGDGKAELIVFRPTDGVWYILNQATNQSTAVQFGISTDKPVIADYDGDGKADIAVVRQTSGRSDWYILGSTRGFYSFSFGRDTDKLVPADYDGDSKIDAAVFRPSNGTWYVQKSTGGFIGLQWGEADDLPVPADYNGDGLAELAVFRPSNGVWYVFNLQNNQANYVNYGQNGDKPVPNSFVN